MVCATKRQVRQDTITKPGADKLRDDISTADAIPKALALNSHYDYEVALAGDATLQTIGNIGGCAPEILYTPLEGVVAPQIHSILRSSEATACYTIQPAYC